MDHEEYLEHCRMGRVAEARVYAGDDPGPHRMAAVGLTSAAVRGHVGVVRMLVTERGRAVDERNGWGWTAAHVAIWNGHVELVRTLVAELGADPNTTDRRHCPLLSHARTPEMVDLLVRGLGAEPNLCHGHQHTDLIASVRTKEAMLRAWAGAAWAVGREADLTNAP